ncbi:hypothetical protein HG531_004876 [Fusarium graminearum]|nr:hypothetical protein HG531_004876 [Fusarium graminearum]
MQPNHLIKLSRQYPTLRFSRVGNRQIQIKHPLGHRLVCTGIINHEQLLTFFQPPPHTPHLRLLYTSLPDSHTHNAFGYCPEYLVRHEELFKTRNAQVHKKLHLVFIMVVGAHCGVGDVYHTGLPHDRESFEMELETI